jgi:hypothetical protein
MMSDLEDLIKELDATKKLLDHARHWSWSKNHLRMALEYLDWQKRKGLEHKSGYRVLYLLGFEPCKICKGEEISCDSCYDLRWVRVSEQRKKHVGC